MMRSAGQGARGEGSPEQTATQLIAQLNTVLQQNEDAETAIDVYKTINWIIGQLEDVKQSALDLAERDMKCRELDTLSTPSGSAGWTEPQTQQLNEEAWERAVSENPRLREIQRTYEAARARLEGAREPYMELPESRFYVR
ncbi:MAG: hypothetical protein U9R48_06130 [Chloroflexota bacterium]|nr:hypothetical protein [Chloroflexota bacterium]